MSNRNEYKLKIRINNMFISKVIIDQHYKEKHDGISDELILDLIKEVDGKQFEIESEKSGFQYFAVEPVWNDKNPYRLVLMLCVFDDFLGVINAFRVQRKSYE